MGSRGGSLIATGENVMSRTPARAALATGLIVSVMIAGPVVTAPAYAISGGTAVPAGSYEFVAKVNLPGRSCSGALIDPGWIITTKTCLAGVDAAAGTAIVGRVDLTGTAGHQVGLVKVVPAPDRDVALVKLASRITDVATVPVGATAPAPGDALVAAGYGRTATDWVPDRLQAARFSVRGVTDAELAVVGESAGVGICRGDAGGPIFRESNGRAELLGVHAASWQNGCLRETPTRQGATETRVDNARSWLQQTLMDLTASPAAKHAINLVWQPVGNQQGGAYRVYGSTSPEVPIGPTTLLGTTSGTTFTHRALPARQTWHYRVVPVAAGGEAVPSGVASATTAVAATTDFNGDGKDDIATAQRGSSGDILVALSDGSAFGPGITWHDFFSFGAEVPLAGDFNGDGRSDVATFQRGAGGDVSVALSDGSRFGVSRKWHELFAAGNEIPVVGDFNGDGKDDIAAFQRGSGGDVLVSLSTGSGFGAATIWHDFFAFRDETPVAGDFNGDGRDDIASFHRGTSGDLYVALSTGSGFAGSVKWHEYFSTGNEVPAVGDFDGDGRDDVATFQRGSAADVWVALSTGSAFGQPGIWHDHFAIDNEIPGTADFNGDGRDDIVTFQRGSAGGVWAAVSDGSAFVQVRPWHGYFSIGQEVPLPGRGW